MFLFILIVEAIEEIKIYISLMIENFRATTARCFTVKKYYRPLRKQVYKSPNSPGDRGRQIFLTSGSPSCDSWRLLETIYG